MLRNIAVDGWGRTGTKDERTALEFLRGYYADNVSQFGKPLFPGFAAVYEPKVPLFAEAPTVTTSNARTRYSAVKKTVVVADRTIMQEQPDSPHGKYYKFHGLYWNDDLCGHCNKEYYIRCEDVTELVNWLKQASGLVKSERLGYLPDIVEISWDECDRSAKPRPLIKPDPSLMKFRIFEDIPAFLDQSIYVPLFKIELPYLEDLDLLTLNDVLDDYPDQASSFKAYLRHALREIASAAHSENVGHHIATLQHDLDEGARIADIKYRSLKSVSALRVTSAVVATMTFVVYSLVCDAPGIVKVLGPGGGLTVLAKEISDYIQARYALTENRFYFLAIAKSRV